MPPKHHGLRAYLIGRTSIYSRGIVNSWLKLEEEGKIKAIGKSIHDRQPVVTALESMVGESNKAALGLGSVAAVCCI